MYASGRGVPKDLVKAEKWCREAAEQGDAGGQFFLGAMYSIGKGVPKDEAEAYAWYSLAMLSREDVREYVDDLKKRLTPEALVRAQQRSRELQKEIEVKKRATGK